MPEMVIFMGCQASGKSTFYQTRFADTHVRINLDMLRTRHREHTLLHTCLALQQALVVDNTNPTREDRRRYIEPALAAGFSVTGYYFESNALRSMTRNQQRTGRSRVPDVAIRDACRRLEHPGPDEGFHQLWFVRIPKGGENIFSIDEWRHEI